MIGRGLQNVVILRQGNARASDSGSNKYGAPVFFMSYAVQEQYSLSLVPLMRTSSNWFILLIISFILYSCQTKSGKIEELRDLRTEVRVNGESFDEEDWEKFELELAKINEDLDKEVIQAAIKEYNNMSRPVKIVVTENDTVNLILNGCDPIP